MKKVIVEDEEIIEQEPEHILTEVQHTDVDFPKESLEPLRGLLFLGALEEEFEFGGHTFVLRTLKEGEVLRIGQLTKNYIDTDAAMTAKRLFTIAAAIVSVDGKELCQEYKEGYDVIYEKANTIKKWYSTVIAFLYGKYIELENAANDICISLKK